MSLVIFDIETNGLLDTVDTFHTGAFCYEGSETSTSCNEEQLVSILKKAGAVTGHNIIMYDMPALRKLGLLKPYYIDGYELHSEDLNVNIVDTLIFSRLLYPEIELHGLAAWGEKLHISKPVIEDWKGLTLEEYEHRCKEDVKINSKLWDIIKRSAVNVERAYEIECHFADIIAKQVENGFTFDSKLAMLVCDAIEKRMDELDKAVLHLMPNAALNKGELKDVKIPWIRYTKTGALVASVQKWLDKHECEYNEYTGLIEHDDGNITDPRVEEYLTVTKKLRLSNKDGMKEYLFSLGWEPEYWNLKKDASGKTVKEDGEVVKMSPKVRQGEAICLSLVGMRNSSEQLNLIVQSYIAYSVYKHRKSCLEGMLKQPRIKVDGKLGADMNTLGASTGRVTHKVVANIPKSFNEFDDKKISVHGVSGLKHIMRACFKASEGYVLVGIDASALEARVEAHYVWEYPGGEMYSVELLGEKPKDIHTLNSKRLGISRDLAKGVKYALGYGASVAKIMSLLRCDRERAEEVYNNYWESAACVKMLLADLEQGWLNSQSRRIITIDGRPLYVDSRHKLLNYLFQSTGTIIMKVAACIMDRRLRAEGLYANSAVRKVCDYHDEFQFEVLASVSGLAERVGKMGIECIRQAGEQLELNVPLDGEYKIGANWGETH